MKMEKKTKISIGKRDVRRTEGNRDENEYDSTLDNQCPIKPGESKRQKKRAGHSKKTKIVKMAEGDEYYHDANFLSFPQLVPSETENDEKKVERVQPEESTFSLNKFSPLPPIPSETNSVRAAALLPVPSNLSRQNSVAIRTRLPPIKKQPMEEKPDSNRKKRQVTPGRKRDTKAVTVDQAHDREAKNKERLERHAKKRRETLEALEIDRAMKIEKHLHRLDLAERNKEQLRQHRKRKLEYEEEKRRKAKERLSMMKDKWRNEELSDGSEEPQQRKMTEL